MKHVVLMCAVLAACAGPAEVPVADEDSPGEKAVHTQCLTDELRGLVGQDQVAARAQVPDLHRIIVPGDLVTQEYLPNRVNVDLNAQGTVTRVWCG